MRTLAQRLGSGTATLYRHFAGRADVSRTSSTGCSVPSSWTMRKLTAMTWQEACKASACAMFDVLRRHRNVAPLLAENVPIGPNAMAARERLIAVLLDNGFPPSLAARSYATLARYVLGFAIQLGGHRTAGNLDDTRLSRVFHDLDPRLFPATVAVADSLPVPLDDEFEFGLDLIVDGLAALLRRERQRMPNVKRRRA